MLAVVLSVLRLTKAKSDARVRLDGRGPHPCAGRHAQPPVGNALAGRQPRARSSTRSWRPIAPTIASAIEARRSARHAAARDRAGRGARPARIRHQRRQVRRAVDGHRASSLAHLVDRSGGAGVSNGRRPAGLRPSRRRRWASACRSCARRSRRSSAAASSTNGGPRAKFSNCNRPAISDSISSSINLTDITIGTEFRPAPAICSVGATSTAATAAGRPRKRWISVARLCCWASAAPRGSEMRTAPFNCPSVGVPDVIERWRQFRQDRVEPTRFDAVAAEQGIDEFVVGIGNKDKVVIEGIAKPQADAIMHPVVVEVFADAAHGFFVRSDTLQFAQNPVAVIGDGA